MKTLSEIIKMILKAFWDLCRLVPILLLGLMVLQAPAIGGVILVSADLVMKAIMIGLMLYSAYIALWVVALLAMQWFTKGLMKDFEDLNTALQCKVVVPSKSI